MNTLILKVCASMDGDGHFHIAELSDRKQVIKNLKRIMDGDVWANQAEEALEEACVGDEADLFKLGEFEWEKFVRSFEQRTQMEIQKLTIK
jgi:hypothetical protein